jgi:hypothetical protein
LFFGCATWPSLPLRSEPLYESDIPRNVLPDSVRRVLEQEPTGSQFRLPHSPWGAGVVIGLAADSYPAASGRTCRRIVIDPDSLARLGLACRLEDGRWVESRVLHDGGRPLPRNEA